MLLEFHGPPDEAYALVDELEEHGVGVDWVPPPGERTGAIEAITIAIIARGSYDAIQIVLRSARERLANRGSVSESEERDTAADEPR